MIVSISNGIFVPHDWEKRKRQKRNKIIRERKRERKIDMSFKRLKNENFVKAPLIL